MILLDHNIPENQAEQLTRWRVHFQQIGHEIGRPEWDDQQEILRYLHREKQPVLFTRDTGFYRSRFCHPNYCIVVIAAPVMETAIFIRRLLRHPEFRTKVLRSGSVIKLSPTKISRWVLNKGPQEYHNW